MSAAWSLNHEPAVTAQVGRIAAAALTQAADQVSAGLTVVRRAQDDPAGRSLWRGVAAHQLRRSLAVDLDALAATVAALREAGQVLDAFARRCSLAAADDVPTVPLATGAAALAHALEAEAARVAADQLLNVAARAPAAADVQAAAGLKGRSSHDALRPDTVVAEVELGAFETVFGTGQAAVAAVNYVGSVVSEPKAHRDDAGELAAAVGELARSPRRTAHELLDVDTWQHNPARAAGRLLPDLLLAATVGGGVAVAARAVGTRASQRVLVRRELRVQAALAARQRLIARAAEHPMPERLRGQVAWEGGPGLRLNGEQVESTRRYLAASTMVRERIQRELEELARTVGGQLAGTEYAVKDLASLNRKVATALHAAPGGRVPALSAILADQSDTVRFTVVLPPKAYVGAARELAALLEHKAVAPSGWANKWDSDRYRGINTSWTDLASGVRFEVQLHTPQSYTAAKRTRTEFEEWRLPKTQADPVRSEELRRVIAREFESAPPPSRVLTLTSENVVPPALRGWAATPPELGGALVAGGVVVATRPTRGEAGSATPAGR